MNRIKLFVIGAALLAASPSQAGGALVAPLDYCRDPATLQTTVMRLYNRVQNDEYPSLPWRLFTVLREFQRNGFVVNDNVRNAVCLGDTWLYSRPVLAPGVYDDTLPDFEPAQSDPVNSNRG